MYTITVYSNKGRMFNYESNVLPMVGDWYSPSSFPTELNPDGNIMIVESRQLNTIKGAENMIIINVAPKLK